MRTRPLICATISAAALLLAACSSPSSATEASRPTTGTSAAVLDCGDHLARQGESPDATAVRCFVDAVLAHRPVRLQLTAPTTEGDPIITTYTADVTGRTTVVVDARQDRFGQKIVQQELCDGPKIVAGGLIFETCTEPRTL